MALKDLIISHQKISEELFENILKDRAELIQEGRKVVLTKEGMRLSSRIKVLLFLAGGNAWVLLDGEPWNSSPSDMEELLGIPGNTLRPILKALADQFLVKSERGKYQILPKGFFELETAIKYEGKEVDKDSGNKKQRSPKKYQGTPSKSGAIRELLQEGFFDSSRDLQEIRDELGRRGIHIKSTSLPSFLLPLVRSRPPILTRDRKMKGKRKVWVYLQPK